MLEDCCRCYPWKTGSFDARCESVKYVKALLQVLSMKYSNEVHSF